MFIIVYTTASNRKEADKIAEALVSEKLAACVNYFPVTSAYVWKKKMMREEEYLLSCKTLKGKFNEIKRRIKELHSYETPCIISVKIDGGSKEFLHWINGSLK